MLSWLAFFLVEKMIIQSNDYWHTHYIINGTQTHICLTDRPDSREDDLGRMQTGHLSEQFLSLLLFLLTNLLKLLQVFASLHLLPPVHISPFTYRIWNAFFTIWNANNVVSSIQLQQVAENSLFIKPSLLSAQCVVTLWAGRFWRKQNFGMHWVLRGITMKPLVDFVMWPPQPEDNLLRGCHIRVHSCCHLCEMFAAIWTAKEMLHVTCNCCQNISVQEPCT